MSLILNGRFTKFSYGGVYRYANEIHNRLEDEFILRTPPWNGRGILGHLWEQQILGRQIPPNSLLWSPTNTGPLSVENQVVTIHDISVLEHPSWYQRSFSTWYKYLLPNLIPKVKKILTDSNFSKERILIYFDLDPEKVVVIPNGVGRPFQPTRDEEWSIPLQIPEDYLLAVGAIQPRKNYSTLVKAWKVIVKRYPSLHLILVGKRGRIFNDVELDDTNHQFHIIPNLDDHSLANLYRNAIALVFPSYYEGFGLPALEALACGTPVIAANNSALPEIVGEAGLYFDPYNIDELIDQMDNFIKNESLRKDLEGRTIAQAVKYSWESTSKKVLHELQSLAKEL